MIKRYSENWGEGGGVYPDDEGDYVEYEDHLAIVKELQERIDDLKMEIIVERAQADY